MSAEPLFVVVDLEAASPFEAGSLIAGNPQAYGDIQDAVNAANSQRVERDRTSVKVYALRALDEGALGLITEPAAYRHCDWCGHVGRRDEGRHLRKLAEQEFRQR